MTERERPSIVSDEHLEYLDALRESGKTNMFGAGPYLRRNFQGLTRNDSHVILSYWMKTFSERRSRKATSPREDGT